MVWSTAVGNGAGHISIAYKDITTTSFVCFGQNWTIHERTSLEPHANYNNVLGWLRSKTTPEVTKKKHRFNWQTFTKNIRNRRNLTNRFY